MGPKRKPRQPTVESCEPERQLVHQILLDTDDPGKWSEDYCLVRLPGLDDDTKQTKVRVCIKTSAELRKYEYKVLQDLRRDIKELFLDFARDLVLQKTNLDTESETDPAGEFAQYIYRDYLHRPAAQTPVEGQPAVVPIEKFYFLLVEPVDETIRIGGEKNRIRVCGYVCSEQYGEKHYLKHVYCTLRGTNMGSALVQVAMRNARACELAYTLLNFNPRKEHLLRLYEGLGFKIAEGPIPKRLFTVSSTDHKLVQLNDNVHASRMWQELTNYQNRFALVGLKWIMPEITKPLLKRRTQSVGTQLPLASLTRGLYCLAIGGDRSAAYFV
jgi:hypothetical protein